MERMRQDHYFEEQHHRRIEIMSKLPPQYGSSTTMNKRSRFEVIARYLAARYVAAPLSEDTEPPDNYYLLAGLTATAPHH